MEILSIEQLSEINGEIIYNGITQDCCFYIYTVCIDNIEKTIYVEV